MESNEPVPTHRKLLVILVGWGCLVAVLFGLYRPSFSAPFYFDTRWHLLKQDNLHLGEVTLEHLDRAIRFEGEGGVYRPLPNLSFAFTYHWFGLDPAAYRIGNLLIHSLAALALLFCFWAVRLTPGGTRAFPEPAHFWSVATLGVLLWAFHPIQTNVVAYVIQRMAGMAGLFTFLSAGAYLRARADPGHLCRKWLLSSLLFFVLGMLCKRNTVTLVPVLLAAEGLLLVPPTVPRDRKLVKGLWIGGAVAGLALCVFFAAPLWENITSRPFAQRFTTGQRLLTELRLQIRYLLVLLVPDPRLLTLDAEVPLSLGWWTPPATAVAGLSLLAVVGAVFRHPKRHPVLAFGVLWFLLHQLVEATVIPLELYYEHRMYIPSAFLFLGVAWGLGRVGRETRRRTRLAWLLAGVLLLGEAGATLARNRVWGDPIAFWSDASVKSPHKPRPMSNLGVVLLEAGRYDEAREALLAARVMGGNRDRIDLNLSTVAFRSGDRVRARTLLEEVVDRGGADTWLALRSLAALAVDERRLEDADLDLARLRALRPHDATGHYLAGTVALLRNQPGEAEEHLRAAVARNPSLHRAWNNLGALLYKTGRFEAASTAFERAAELAPEISAYHANLQKAETATVFDAGNTLAPSGPQPE